jgi:hypothetical protein
MQGPGLTGYGVERRADDLVIVAKSKEMKT